VVRQQALGQVGDQNRIANDRIAAADLLDGQIVGQVARADDLDSVVEDLTDPFSCSDRGGRARDLPAPGWCSMRFRKFLLCWMNQKLGGQLKGKALLKDSNW